MKKYFVSVFLLLAVLLMGTSCKSTPADGHEALTARVEEARMRAIDFQSPSYFPSEWEEVEAQFAEAISMPTSNNAERQAAVAALETVAEAYDELFEKTIPLYAQAREDEILAVREELVNSGFADLFPEFIRGVDEIALLAYEKYEEGDYYGARDTAAEALSEYETLQTGARVLLTRQEIIDRGFLRFDPENFERADELAQEAVEKYKAGDKDGAISSAEEAQLRFDLVLTNAWVVFAGDHRRTATAERELALAQKVNIAMRDAFREADGVFTRAEIEFRAQRYENAARYYIDAEAFFTMARVETEGRRLRAVDAIREAEERIEESVETAAEAERIIEGVSR